VLPEPGTTDLATMEKRLLDLEIGEDGSLRLFCGRASDTFGTRFIPDEATEAVFESLVLGLTKRLVLIAATIADTTDYLGPWDFGVAVVGLSGLVSLRLVQRATWAPTPYSEKYYRQTVRATHAREEITAWNRWPRRRLCGQRGVRTQNSLPSGSAITTHDTSSG
jgi:hypothetical protein